MKRELGPFTLEALSSVVSYLNRTVGSTVVIRITGLGLEFRWASIGYDKAFIWYGDAQEAQHKINGLTLEEVEALYRWKLWEALESAECNLDSLYQKKEELEEELWTVKTAACTYQKHQEGVQK